MKKFKELNQFERLGLIKILEEPFPFIDKIICGTCDDNLINLQNTITDNSPNDKFCMLGAVGITEGHDVVLEFWDYPEENEYRLYWLTLREAKDFNALNDEHFNCLLKNYQSLDNDDELNHFYSNVY